MKREDLLSYCDEHSIRSVDIKYSANIEVEQR